MNYEFDPSVTKAAQEFAALVAAKIAPDAAEQDANPASSASILKRHFAVLGEAGYLKALVDPSMGGIGMPHLEWTLRAEPLAAASPATFLSAATSGAALRAVELFGTPAAIQRWVTPSLTGQIVAAAALTEADSGSDALAVKTTAKPAEGGWRLDGEKVYVTNAPIADVILVLAATRLDAGVEGMSLFAVPADAPGLVVGERIATLGYRGVMTASVRLEGCRVDADALIGDEGAGFGAATHIFQRGRLAVSVGSVGMGEAALSMSLSRALERRTAGGKLIKHQEVAFKISQMKMLLDAGRLLSQFAAWTVDERDPQAGPHVSAAKVHTTEALTRIANMTMQIFAGAGYTAGHPAERLYRDAKLGEILFGTTEIQRVMLAKDAIARYYGAA